MHPIIYTYQNVFKRKIERSEFLAFKRLFQGSRDVVYIKKCITTFKENEDKLKRMFWKQKMFILEKKYANISFNQIPQNVENIMVIVEPRKHTHFKAVLKNMVYHLPHWGLHIFHGTENKQFLLDIIGQDHKVTLTNLQTDNLTMNDYNNLLTSIDFWKQIKGENVLIFQTDVLLRKGDIEKFLEYDYIGSPWDPLNPCVKQTKSVVGNGGFSLRSRHKSEKICEKYLRENSNEDVFFSQYMTAEKHNIPDVTIARKFSIGQETREYKSKGKNPLGLHKIYNNPYLRLDDIKELLDF